MMGEMDQHLGKLLKVRVGVWEQISRRIQIEDYMSNKQNLVAPIRQGRAFRIKLGLSDGPFLPQDMMHSNEKSIHMLAASEVLNSQLSMSRLMRSMDRDENIQSKIVKGGNQVENFFSKCEFIQGQILCLAEDSRKLRSQQISLKEDIKTTYRVVLEENDELLKNCMPVLRGFAKTIRDHSCAEKDISLERQRDIQELKVFRSAFLDNILKCETKIMQIENTLGVASKNSMEDQKFIE